MFKFTIRDLLWLTLVAALVVALVYTKRPVASGRYQFVATDLGPKYVFDTISGQIWIQVFHAEGEWREYPSPSLSDNLQPAAKTGSTGP